MLESVLPRTPQVFVDPSLSDHENLGRHVVNVAGRSASSVMGHFVEVDHIDGNSQNNHADNDAAVPELPFVNPNVSRAESR